MGWQRLIFGVALGGVVALALVGCVGAGRSDMVRTEPVDVSIISLIATPEKYDRRTVRVIGFFRLEFEGTALYLHQEDYRRRLSNNAVWIVTSPSMGKELSDNYVLIEGIFDASNTGHGGMFGGAIRNIRRAERWAIP